MNLKVLKHFEISPLIWREVAMDKQIPQSGAHVNILIFIATFGHSWFLQDN